MKATAVATMTTAVTAMTAAAGECRSGDEQARSDCRCDRDIP